MTTEALTAEITDTDIQPRAFRTGARRDMTPRPEGKRDIEATLVRGLNYRISFKEGAFVFWHGKPVAINAGEFALIKHAHDSITMPAADAETGMSNRRVRKFEFRSLPSRKLMVLDELPEVPAQASEADPSEAAMQRRRARRAGSR